jgi:hypothetical protein
VRQAIEGIEFHNHIPTAVGRAMTRSRDEQTAIVVCMTYLRARPLAVLTEELAKEELLDHSTLVTYDCGQLVMPPETTP